MPFQANQLHRIRFRKSEKKWVSWKELVAEFKDQHNRAGRGYPLEFSLYGADGELLIKQKFDWVHDRDSKMKVVVLGEWDVPLTFGWCEGPDRISAKDFFVEDIRLPESLGRQAMLSETVEDE